MVSNLFRIYICAHPAIIIWRNISITTGNRDRDRDRDRISIAIPKKADPNHGFPELIDLLSFGMFNLKFGIWHYCSECLRCAITISVEYIASALQIKPKVMIWLLVNGSPKMVMPSTSMHVGAMY